MRDHDDPRPRGSRPAPLVPLPHGATAAAAHRRRPLLDARWQRRRGASLDAETRRRRARGRRAGEEGRRLRRLRDPGWGLHRRSRSARALGHPRSPARQEPLQRRTRRVCGPQSVARRPRAARGAGVPRACSRAAGGGGGYRRGIFAFEDRLQRLLRRVGAFKTVLMDAYGVPSSRAFGHGRCCASKHGRTLRRLFNLLAKPKDHGPLHVRPHHGDAALGHQRARAGRLCGRETGPRDVPSFSRRREKGRLRGQGQGLGRHQGRNVLGRHDDPGPPPLLLRALPAGRRLRRRRLRVQQHGHESARRRRLWQGEMPRRDAAARRVRRLPPRRRQDGQDGALHHLPEAVDLRQRRWQLPVLRSVREAARQVV
mmetsp:Transcript_6898/g.22364  ORF Transcript_6898/g.22364 Transcript_6898/m.22364 type:complete len:370 (-) Transcript_6898:294-1403(-)